MKMTNNIIMEKISLFFYRELIILKAFFVGSDLYDEANSFSNKNTNESLILNIFWKKICF